MLRVTVCFLVGLFSFSVFAQTDDLMIVEYQDYDPGDGFQIKILNPTATSINLSNYYLQVYNNGNLTASSSSQLTGALGAGKTLIIGNNHSCTSDLSLAVSGVNNDDCIAITLGNSTNFVDMINLYGVGVKPMIDNQNNAMFHKKLVRDNGNCTRYTSTDGVSNNSWKASPSANNPGWTVSGTTCLTAGSTFQAGPTAVESFSACEGETVVIPASGVSITSDTTFTEMRSNPGGCDSTITVTVTFLPQPTSTKVINACEGDVVSHLGFNLTSDTTFEVTVPNLVSCDSLITYHVIFNPSPSATEYYEFCAGTSVDVNGILVSADTTVIELRPNGNTCDSLIYMEITFVGEQASGDWIYLDEDSTFIRAVNTSGGNVAQTAFFWGDNSETIQAGASQAQHTYSEPGLYNLKIVSESDLGCTDTVSFDVWVPEDVLNKKLFIPNVFTPNGDGANDLFAIKGNDVLSYHIQIYTRWGQLIFESNDIEKPWDGKYNGQFCPEGTYLYHVISDGEKQNGFLTLFR